MTHIASTRNTTGVLNSGGSGNSGSPTGRQASALRHAVGAVALCFGIQGLGFASVVTALPAAKERLNLSDLTISAVMLGVCIAAALGSIIAETLAVRRGSRTVLTVGFAVQAAAMAAICLAGLPWLFAVAAALFGLSVGMVDAGNNMQGIAAQSALGRPVMGRLYAVFTAAGIIAALAAAGVVLVDVSPWLPVGIIGVLDVGVAVMAWRWLLSTARSASLPAGSSAAPTDPSTAPAHAATAARARRSLPWPTIWICGSMILVAFLLDSAIAAWSTLYLRDGMDTSGAIAPLGYAAYLGLVLVSRLSTDAAVARWGRRRIAAVCAVAGIIGGVLVVVMPIAAVAIVGFGICGVAAGVLVPVAFAAAGSVDAHHADEIIARVNIFNYVGAVVGSVLPGVLGEGPQLRFGFVAPALALVVVLPLVRRLPQGRPTVVTVTA